jgi:hypothetical protein
MSRDGWSSGRQRNDAMGQKATSKDSHDGPQPHPHSWHSRADRGAAHSITKRRCPACLQLVLNICVTRDQNVEAANPKLTSIRTTRQDFPLGLCWTTTLLSLIYKFIIAGRFNMSNTDISTGGPDRTRPSSIMQFAIKACIVAVVISASTIFVSGWIVESISEQLRATGGSQFWRNVEQALDNAASPSSDMPQEKKQKLLQDIHRIVARWRPFIDAVQTDMEKPAEKTN